MLALCIGFFFFRASRRRASDNKQAEDDWEALHDSYTSSGGGGHNQESSIEKGQVKRELPGKAFSRSGASGNNSAAAYYVNSRPTYKDQHGHSQSYDRKLPDQGDSHRDAALDAFKAPVRKAQPVVYPTTTAAASNSGSMYVPAPSNSYSPQNTSSEVGFASVNRQGPASSAHYRPSSLYASSSNYQASSLAYARPAHSTSGARTAPAPQPSTPIAASEAFSLHSRRHRAVGFQSGTESIISG